MLQVPSLDADYGLDAAQFLSQATGGGKRMTASIERRERRQQGRGKDPLGSQPLLHLVLSKDGASTAESINADMLKAGLARVKAGKTKQVSASSLRTHYMFLWPVALLAAYGVLHIAIFAICSTNNYCSYRVQASSHEPSQSAAGSLLTACLPCMLVWVSTRVSMAG